MRADPSFYEFLQQLNTNLSGVVGRPLTPRELTGNLTAFLYEERVHERIIRRARYLNKGRKPGRIF